MKRNTWITLFILAIIAAGIIYIATRGTSLPIVKEDGSFEGKYSLKNIVALKKPYECLFTKSDEAASVNGLIRTDGEKIRGDFDITTTIPGSTIGENVQQDFASHLIVNEDVAYVWTTLSRVGYKTKYTNSASTNASPEEQSQIVGMNDKIDYRCTQKAVDESIFNLPEAITFSELKR